MNFGQAVEALKKGQPLRRVGWNGKGIFIYYVPATRAVAQTPLAMLYFGRNKIVTHNAYFAIKNTDDTISTWVPSVNDALADDWEVIADVAFI